MRSVWAFSIFLALVAIPLASPSQAQDVPPPVSEEFVGLFTSYCLEKFPDDAAMEQQVTARDLEPLTAAELRGILLTDPGHGWSITGLGGKYSLTLELPPYHVCGVRRYSDHVMNSAPFIAAARAFADAKGRKLKLQQFNRIRNAFGLISDATLLQELDDKGHPLDEVFMFIVVDYPAVTMPDGTQSKPFFDIRFVRQIYIQ